MPSWPGGPASGSPAQNDDGGWGDTDANFSNFSATLLVCSALRLTGVAEACRPQMDRAAAYIEAQGGTAGLRRRYGKDKTFAAPILANCASAGMIPLRDVPALPLSWPVSPFGASLPAAAGRRYALPRWWPSARRGSFTAGREPVGLARAAALRGPQSADVGADAAAQRRFSEAAPLTSFVVMSLASTGRVDHPVACHGVAFLLSSVREDGSWPIDVSLANWNTSLAITALAAAASDLGALDCVGWFLRSQWTEVHPFTQSPPGGWG